MTREVVLGIDIGTSGAKALLVDPAGAVVARGAAPLPAPDSEGPRREQDAGLWWHAAATALGAALTQFHDAGGRPDAVRAIAVDATSGTVVPVDAALRPLRKGLMYHDGRAVAEADMLNTADPAALTRLGYRFNASFSAAKILWLCRHEPEIAARTRWYLHQADVITSALMETDRPIGDESNALKSGYDLIERRWPDLLADVGIDRSRLPTVVSSGATLGTVGPSIAARFGLRRDCRLVAGMSDGTAAAAASGMRAVGDMNTTLGTTIVWKTLSTALIRDPEGRLYCHRHPSGLFLPGGSGNAGGAGIAVLVEAAEPGASGRLDALAAAIRTGPPSPFLTYPAPATGERFPFLDPDFAPFTTTPDGDVEARYLSALEGAGFIERWGYDVARELGAECDGIVWTTGTGAMIDPWMQVRADILGRVVTRARTPESGFGAAIVAAMNIWHDGDWSAAAEAMITPDRRFEPDPARHRRYTDRYAAFRAEVSRRRARPA